MGSVMASDQRVRFWGARWFFHFYLVILLGYFGGGLWALIAGASERHGTAPLITGIFITVISVPAVVIMGRLCVVPMVVEDAVLKIPGAFGTKTIPLAEISRLGLIWRREYRNTGWGLQIWDGAEQPVRIRHFMATLEVSEDDHRIAASSAGRAATRLYEAVILVVARWVQGAGRRVSADRSGPRRASTDRQEVSRDRFRFDRNAEASCLALLAARSRCWRG